MYYVVGIRTRKLFSMLFTMSLSSRSLFVMLQTQQDRAAVLLVETNGTRCEVVPARVLSLDPIFDGASCERRRNLLVCSIGERTVHHSTGHTAWWITPDENAEDATNATIRCHVASM